MINFSTMKLALYNWASTNSGITTVWAYQNSPQPPFPFLTLYLFSFIQIGFDEVNLPNNAGSSKIVGQREFTMTCTAEGSNAMGILEALANSLEKPSVQASLRANNLVYIRRISINDLPTLEETQYKERAALDIQFRIADIFNDDVGLIEHVELTENYYDVDQLVYTTTNIIPPIP